MRAQDQQPIVAEGTATGDLTPDLQRAVRIRIPGTRTRVQIRIAVPQRRALIHRGMRPIPVRRDRRHKHGPLRDVGQDLRRGAHHRRTTACHIDHDVPRPLPRQPPQVVEVLAVPTDHLYAGGRCARQTPMKDGHLQPSPDRVLYDDTPDEPRAT